MQKVGCRVGKLKNKNITSDLLKEMILRYGKNIGSWAPGELDKMVRDSRILELSIETSGSCLTKQWGSVERSNIMIKGNDIIILCIRIGNVVIMPEPARGRGVIIDHLIPAVRADGLYHEYRRLYGMIQSPNRSRALASQTARGKMDKIEEIVRRLGIDKDLGMWICS